MEPDPTKGPRSIGSVEQALLDALQHVSLGDEDQAVVALAKRYAMLLDSRDGTFALVEGKSLGRDFLAVLSALRMTPQARAAVLKGGVQGGQSALDKLRAARSS